MTWFGQDAQVPSLEWTKVLCRQMCGCTHSVYSRVDGVDSANRHPVDYGFPWKTVNEEGGGGNKTSGKLEDYIQSPK